jgi:hypothetical protein
MIIHPCFEWELKWRALLVRDHQLDTFGTFFRTNFIIFNLETKKFDTVQLGSSPN